ncbi:MAG: hypothetical protein ACSHYF_17640 [Verrucomicrobiaceae bacterium]
MNKRNLATAAILAVASLQMVGHFTGSKNLRGLGILSGISPYPKVFCEADGYEPFAANFTLIGEDATGTTLEIPLTAERYSQLAGPYNRRNVYGAALAYAPRLPDDLRAHLFTQLDPLFAELNLPSLENPRLRITARPGETTSEYLYPLSK